MNDRDGWPIHVGAKVRVGRRHTAMAPDSEGMPGYSGHVVKIDEAKGYLQLRECGIGARRDARASDCRVQRNAADLELTKPKPKTRTVRKVRRGKVG